MFPITPAKMPWRGSGMGASDCHRSVAGSSTRPRRRAAGSPHRTHRGGRRRRRPQCLNGRSATGPASSMYWPSDRTPRARSRRWDCHVLRRRRTGPRWRRRQCGCAARPSEQAPATCPLPDRRPQAVADHVGPGATGDVDLSADHGHRWRSAVRVPHRRYLGPRVTAGIVDKGPRACPPEGIEPATDGGGGIVVRGDREGGGLLPRVGSRIVDLHRGRRLAVRVVAGDHEDLAVERRRNLLPRRRHRRQRAPPAEVDWPSAGKRLAATPGRPVSTVAVLFMARSESHRTRRGLLPDASGRHSGRTLPHG